jgi:hypothetical protein
MRITTIVLSRHRDVGKWRKGRLCWPCAPSLRRPAKLRPRRRSPYPNKSEWVTTEIYNVRQVELRQQRRKLFPIRLTDMDTLKAWKCPDADTGKDLAREVREYFIPDFK